MSLPSLNNPSGSLKLIDTEDGRSVHRTPCHAGQKCVVHLPYVGLMCSVFVSRLQWSSDRVRQQHSPSVCGQ